MALYSRHPRFTIAVLILVFASFLLFANSAWDGPLVGSMDLYRDNLAESVKTEEAYYQEMVEERQDFIRKIGPTPDKISAFSPVLYTIWDFLLPAFNCPHRRRRMGVIGDGGKWVCGMERIVPKKSCVIYSFGIGTDSSFEAAILKEAPRCELYGYDFTVTSFGPEIELEPDLKRRSHFFAYALGHKDAFDAVSDAVNVTMYTLRTLMKQNGHAFIDVLKIDVEGDEFRSLSAFIDSFRGEPLPSGQLQIELHFLFNVDNLPIAKILQWWEKLEAAGLRPFFNEVNLPHVVRSMTPTVIEYSFINIRGQHELITDRPLAHRRIPH